MTVKRGLAKLIPEQRTTAAALQIASLNPLVSLRMIPTVAPFIRHTEVESVASGSEKVAVDWLRQEGVDVVVGCDLKQDQVVSRCPARAPARRKIQVRWELIVG